MSALDQSSFFFNARKPYAHHSTACTGGSVPESSSRVHHDRRLQLVVRQTPYWSTARCRPAIGWQPYRMHPRYGLNILPGYRFSPSKSGTYGAHIIRQPSRVCVCSSRGASNEASACNQCPNQRRRGSDVPGKKNFMTATLYFVFHFGNQRTDTDTCISRQTRTHDYRGTSLIFFQCLQVTSRDIRKNRYG